MQVERKNDNQILITLSSSVDSFGLQRILDYLKYLEATASTKATQKTADELADELNSSWWEQNGKRFAQ